MSKNNEPAHGMTMRQWYKGQAVIKITVDDEVMRYYKPEYVQRFCEDMAKLSGKIADALLAEDAAREEVNHE